MTDAQPHRTSLKSPSPMVLALAAALAVTSCLSACAMVPFLPPEPAAIEEPVHDEELSEPREASASPGDAAPTPSDVEPLPKLPVPRPPANFTDDDAQGAIAAAIYFLELHDYALDSGDTGALDIMSGVGCEVCTGWINHAEEVHASGRRVRQETAELLAEPEAFADPDLDGVTVVHVRDAPGVTQVIDPDGRVGEELVGGKSREHWISLARDEMGWFVHSYNAIEIYQLPELRVSLAGLSAAVASGGPEVAEDLPRGRAGGDEPWMGGLPGLGLRERSWRWGSRWVGSRLGNLDEQQRWG